MSPEQIVSVHLVRRPILEGLMRALGVAKAEVVSYGRSRFGAVRIGAQADLLVLSDALQPLDEYVADPSTLAVQVDRNAGILQHFDPLLAGKLRSPVTSWLPTGLRSSDYISPEPKSTYTDVRKAGATSPRLKR
jgi:hypothetical protein